MPRQLSAFNQRALIEHWEKLLTAVEWHELGAGVRTEKLISILSITRADISADCRKLLRNALQELLSAMGPKEGRASSKSGVDALHSWIRHYVLEPGPEQLLPEPARRRELARQRDTQRRKANADAGLVSARIEMAATTWAKLRAIQESLGTNTQSETLARLIKRYTINDRARVRKDEKSGPGSPSLF